MNNTPTETCRYTNKGKTGGSFTIESPSSIKRVDIDFEKIKQKMKKIYEEEDKKRRKIIVSDYFVLDNTNLPQTKVYSWEDLTNVKRSTLLREYFKRNNISFDFKNHRDYIYNNIVFNKKTMTIESLEYRLR